MADERFEPGWLELREPADHRARDPSLLESLVEAWRRRGWCRVLDLGCGTGSNLRFLAPRLPGRQAWTLLDHDPELLARIAAPPTASPETLELRPVRGDLAADGLPAVADAHLVTASALLDLVSAEWLDALAEACRAASCGAYLVLTWDGAIRWDRPAPDDGLAAVERSDGPIEDADDRLVARALAAHQRRDKGLGLALGPDAALFAERAFRRQGFRTRMGASPWHLRREEAALAGALVDGWARAATEEDPEEAARIRAWARRRTRAVGEGTARLTVGHLDLLALPGRA